MKDTAMTRPIPATNSQLDQLLTGLVDLFSPALGTALDAEGKLRDAGEIVKEYEKIHERHRESYNEVIDAICQQQYSAICGDPPPPKPKPGPNPKAPRR